MNALPVLWMSSYFHIMERMGQTQRRRVCFVQFVRWRHRGVEDSRLHSDLPTWRIGQSTADAMCSRAYNTYYIIYAYRVLYITIKCNKM